MRERSIVDKNNPLFLSPVELLLSFVDDQFLSHTCNLHHSSVKCGILPAVHVGTKIAFYICLFVCLFICLSA